MLSMRNVTALVGAALLAVGMSGAITGAAIAGTVACDATTADDVTGSVACAISDTNDHDSPAPDAVNADGFFTFSDWDTAGKQNTGGLFEAGNVNIGFNATTDGQSGTWSISSWDGIADVMLIFKDGANTMLVGFLLDGTSLSGTWTSPFHAPDFNVSSIKDTSHISAYVRLGDEPPCERDCTPLPEPGPIGLLGGGMVVLYFVRRRRFLS